jgi:hypothetical protein
MVAGDFNDLKKAVTSASTSLSPGASFLAASAYCEHQENTSDATAAAAVTTDLTVSVVIQ